MRRARRARLVTALSVLPFLLGVSLTNVAEASPDQEGQWSAPFGLGGVGIHAILTHTGDVLLFEYAANRRSRVFTWNPQTGVAGDAAMGYDRDIFCAGHNVLPDGRVFISGGHEHTGIGGDGVGVADADIYDPVTRTWTPTPPLTQKRWYPTNVGISDGTTLVFGGQAERGDKTDEVDSYDPVPNTMTQLPPSATRVVNSYPRMHLMPTGKILMSGPAPMGRYFNPATNSWGRGVARMQFGSRAHGNAVLLPGLEKILAIGGQIGNGAATNTVEVLDTAAPSPRWTSTTPMSFARIHPNSVTLPDGKVLVVGGGASGKYTGPVKAPEMYDPGTGTWTVLAPQQGGRMYHSTALLLPDGRVLSAGQDNGPLATTAEIFSPPYLFRGPRPVIDSAPTALGYGAAFDISSADATDVADVVLVRPSAVTHATDSDQRLVRLPFTASGAALAASAPASASAAPPGYYMLFLVNSQGVPSMASWVRLG